MKFQDMHSGHLSQPPLHRAKVGVGVNFPKNIFARNLMKFLDVQRNFMFANIQLMEVRS